MTKNDRPVETPGHDGPNAALRHNRLSYLTDLGFGLTLVAIVVAVVVDGKLGAALTSAGLVSLWLGSKYGQEVDGLGV